MNEILIPANFPLLIQQFFYNRLINQQNISAQTVSSYRDTFRILLRFIESTKGIKASSITFDIFNVDLVISFLNYLEEVRGNTIRTRNNSLAAIRSFIQFVSYQNPELLSITQRIIAIPSFSKTVFVFKETDFILRELLLVFSLLLASSRSEI